MSEFTVRRRFEGRKSWQAFEKRLEAENETIAVEHVPVRFGPAPGPNRTQVEIEEARLA